MMVVGNVTISNMHVLIGGEAPEGAVMRKMFCMAKTPDLWPCRP